MHRFGIKLLPLGALAILLSAGLPGCEIQSSGPEAATAFSSAGWKIAVGEKLPPFRLSTVSGETVKLEDFSGKPVVVSLFATWCGPCRAELPQLENRVWQAMKGKGVQVVAISRGEEKGAVETFLQELPLSFPVLLDSDEEYSSKLAGQGIPRLIITDRNHVVRHLEIGYAPPAFAKMVKLVEAVAERSEEGK